MSMLNDDLSDFARSIVRSEALSSRINADYRNYSVETAIEVYRNNYRGNLHDTLALVYPVIEQLVGKDFFRFMTRNFINQYQSRGGNLHYYGGDMASFIAAFEPAKELVYLPDVAALEWACHSAYFADDQATLDLGKLAQIPPEQYAELILHVHPACQVVSSRYPVAAIWHAHQPGAPGDFHIDLDRGPCNALVSRKEDSVRVVELSDADTAWLRSIQAGIALGAATDTTLELYSDFDLESTLHKLLQLDVLVEG
jgi:hypothetical protein